MFTAEINPQPTAGRRRFACLTDERNAAEVDRVIAEWRAQTIAVPAAVAVAAGPNAGASAVPPDEDDDDGDDSEIEWIPPPETYDRAASRAREAMTATVGVPVVSEATALAQSAMP